MDLNQRCSAAAAGSAARVNLVLALLRLDPELAHTGVGGDHNGKDPRAAP